MLEPSPTRGKHQASKAGRKTEQGCGGKKEKTERKEELRETQIMDPHLI